MANEIHIDYDSGYTLYFIIRNSAGLPWDTTGEDFEAWNAMGDYDIAMTDKTGSRYMGSIPANLAAGRHSVQVFLQDGGAPADDDQFLGGREILWNGTAEEYVLDSNGRIDVGIWLGQAVTLSGGNKPDVNVDEISDDATAPDTLELIVENAKGADHKLLISSDAQDLSATLDVNTKLVVGATPITLANINAEVDTALADLNLDHFIQVASLIRNDSTVSTTTILYTELAEATADHYNNMTILFTSGILAGQARRVSDYSNDATDGIVTVYPAFTDVPGDNDTFIIIPPYFYAPIAGALEITYTVKKDNEDTGDPIDGVEVWITTDSGGTNVIWSGTTDTNGVLRDVGDSKPWLDSGTYFFWRKKAGYVFTNPDTETFS